jgi:hypothetical protein
MFKREIRVIGWDDISSPRVPGKEVLIIGAITRGGNFLDGMLSTKITYDGLDATEKISKSINNSRHKPQLRIIMTDGITFAGFNLVDIKELYRTTELPVIVIQRKMPDLKKFLSALKKFDDYNERKLIVKHAGKVFKYNKICFQKAGITKNDAIEIIQICTTHGNIPEPIRVAHIIATGLSGESKGRA